MVYKERGRQTLTPTSTSGRSILQSILKQNITDFRRKRNAEIQAQEVRGEMDQGTTFFLKHTFLCSSALLMVAFLILAVACLIVGTAVGK